MAHCPCVGTTYNGYGWDRTYASSHWWSILYSWYNLLYMAQNTIPPCHLAFIRTCRIRFSLLFHFLFCYLLIPSPIQLDHFENRLVDYIRYDHLVISDSSSEKLP